MPGVMESKTEGHFWEELFENNNFEEGKEEKRAILKRKRTF